MGYPNANTPPRPQTAPARWIANFSELFSILYNAVFSVNEKNLGVNGAVGAGAGDTINGDFFALQAIGDTVLTSYAVANDTGDSMAGLTLPSGIVVYGNFTQVVVTSGYVRAYKK